MLELVIELESEYEGVLVLETVGILLCLGGYPPDSCDGG